MLTDSSAYLTFLLGKEKFAIKVDYVQEIVEFGQVTSVPQAPAYMLGIINLRGRILPLLDTKMKLGLSRTEITNKTRIMVLDIRNNEEKTLQVGALVDIASEVIEISAKQILPPPDADDKNQASPVTGIVNDHGSITMIMDVTRVFINTEIAEFEQSLN